MKKLLSGNEAVARGIYEAGVKFASAYPGTPSTEILENVVQYKKDVYCEWAPNEKVALEAVIGASMGGVRAISVMKHVGLNVAADPLFSMAYIGSNGGIVIITADEPSMHSSQNEQDNRHYARAAKIPCIEPSDSQEAKDFIIAAFEISEKFDTPVLFRMTTRICHSKSIVELGKKKEVPSKGFTKNFQKYVVLPANARKLHLKVEERLKKLEKYGYNCLLNKLEINDSKIGIITNGIAYQYAKEVFPDASILKLGLTFPIPKKLISEFAKKVKTLYVIEELEPFFEEQIKAMGIKIIGKDKLPITFEFNTNIVEENLLNRKSYREIEVKNLPPRPPALCPGCPHRAPFYTLHKLDVNVTGDIGCYTLGGLPPLSAIHTCVCMGASIGCGYGIEKAMEQNPTGKVVAVIGDSTFVHSGITELINVIYNKGISTICIMDNSITAMTGHQEHPGTGKTLMGEQTHKLDLIELVKACGVKKENLRPVNAFDLKEIMTVFKEELAKSEPSVIITQGPCIFIEPKNKKWKLFEIDSEKCKACGICLQIGCPAISKSDDNKAVIDPIFCLGCTVCVQVCPFDSIIEIKR
ncbi:MAG: indolepyruvate ferredoxin oxidoreductase subunit alpha [Candidatus Cloacimonetes bacterium]|nr:indolepyruvate ferredoxin oxidoreductase subunit alpha [Candidatus Cloacimonadota bacterium]